ncbi:DUF308 domain-containing protein [Aliiroseovarius sp. PTFE2010]|uniref:DUF308 domain-containing protein n=1 Tax=Aliiroseovarius sp. PTFE2010 TaxID=3417190 RepID=UPI003CF08F31
MTPPKSPLFLQRRSYRRRRLADAARLVPVIGAALWLVPLLWHDGARSSTALLYVFGVWALLIGATLILSRGLARSHDERPGAPGRALFGDPDHRPDQGADHGPDNRPDNRPDDMPDNRPDNRPDPAERGGDR